ncbi:MBL fold metallo-hydrolase [Streptomyces platensis]|uniref:MBL fold metallo-hydrolase n=1 Tax=Streptomyces platensis TaxID=58346 RepID=UPI00378A2D8D
MSNEPSGVHPPQLQQVADDVFAYVQAPGGWCLNNAGIIADADRVTLVDTAATENRARALRKAAATVTPEPPHAIVNTHFHGDHTFGNCVFPEAIVIGHEDTRTQTAEAGLHLTGLWPDVEWGDITVTPPTVTFHDRLTVHTGAVRMELVHLGPGHSPGDTVVWLPDRSVLFTGDLAMSGVTPFVPMGSVTASLQALETMREWEPRTVVPGHGPVGGPEILDATERYLLWLRGLAREGVAGGLTPRELADTAGPGPFGELIDSERLLPNLARAYAEERGAAPGEPLDIGALFAEMVDHHGGLPACHA